MTYLGMVENMVNDMIKQYAYLLAQKLKITKELDDDDPVIVTLHNILMVAPKNEGSNNKLELTVKDEIAKEEENLSINEEEDKPLTFEDFKKKFQTKHSLVKKEPETADLQSTSNNK